ncbi:MAG: type II toxin-antitoxin system death-on-curing family toxin [Candidatus Saccharibacteria bacterium]|nr:type II toxin-antitoxin system death-on-curing family toxin [Candidatus Saccharibacteria bacterium]
MKTLSLEHIIQIHVLVLQQTGGGEGLRDLGRLEAVIATQTQEVFGEELYKTVFEKAGAMCRGIVADHPFVDGNKRTAMLVSTTYLAVNGHEFIAKKGELEDFAVRIAVEHLDIAVIATWLKAHIK